MKMPSPVKSGLPSEFIPEINSKIKLNKDMFPKEVSSSNVIDSPIKKHVPKPPFFSKITNDVQTINTFFYSKFIDVRLLYRAS